MIEIGLDLVMGLHARRHTETVRIGLEQRLSLAQRNPDHQRVRIMQARDQAVTDVPGRTRLGPLARDLRQRLRIPPSLFRRHLRSVARTATTDRPRRRSVSGCPHDPGLALAPAGRARAGRRRGRRARAGAGRPAGVRRERARPTRRAGCGTTPRGGTRRCWRPGCGSSAATTCGWATTCCAGRPRSTGGCWRASSRSTGTGSGRARRPTRRCSRSTTRPSTCAPTSRTPGSWRPWRRPARPAGSGCCSPPSRRGRSSRPR